MSQLDIEHRERRFPWWIVWALGALILLVIIGLVLSRTVLATPPGAEALDVSNVSEVLEYGNLPRAFSYGGITWEAVESGRFGETLPLIRIGPSVEGHPIYYERGTPTEPYRTLYMPAAETGQYANVFVRYNPATSP